MTALLQFDLSLDTHADFTASFVFGTALNELQSFVGATAQMMIRSSPADPAPILALSTTANVNGQLFLGQAPPGPFGATVANIAALVAFDASALASGTLVAVTTPAAYYAWSPGGVLTPDGVSVVTGSGGQWLLTATIVVQIAHAAMLFLVGARRAAYDLLVTFSDGTTLKFLEGAVLVDQSNTWTA
jgi:hypothetical protein